MAGLLLCVTQEVPTLALNEVAAAAHDQNLQKLLKYQMCNKTDVYLNS